MLQKGQVRKMLSLRVKCPGIQCVRLPCGDIELAALPGKNVPLVVDQRCIYPGLNILVVISVVFQHLQRTACWVHERLSWFSRIPDKRYPLEPNGEYEVNHAIRVGLLIVQLVHIWCLALDAKNITLLVVDYRRDRF
jgi:hypothetical protein